MSIFCRTFSATLLIGKFCWILVFAVYSSMAHCRTSWRMQCHEHASKLFFSSSIRTEFSSSLILLLYFYRIFQTWLYCLHRTCIKFLQLSQSEMEKRPSYDYIQGANVTPTTFYNIGDLEVQDNLARIWCHTEFIFLPS